MAQVTLWSTQLAVAVKNIAAHQEGAKGTPPVEAPPFEVLNTAAVTELDFFSDGVA
jgi:hypothetical protein